MEKEMPKIKGLRWYMIGLVAIGIVINYMDRNALSVAASTINKELGITTQQYSYIVASFQASYLFRTAAKNCCDRLPHCFQNLE